MNNIPLTPEQWERLIRHTLAPEEIPAVYAYLASHPEDRAKLTAQRNATPAEIDLELDLLFYALQDGEPLTEEQMAAYVDGTLSPIERECMESRLAIDSVSREEMRRMQSFRDQLDAAPAFEIAPLSTSAPLATADSTTASEEKQRSVVGRQKLPGKIASWARSMVTSEIITPVKALRESLALLQRLAAAAPTPALRGGRPEPLSPRLTAVRAPQPVLRWQGVPRAQEYAVFVSLQPTDAEPDAAPAPKLLWTQSVGLTTEVTLPADLLEPGKIYVWQVAVTLQGSQGERKRSSQVWFLTLPAEVTQELEVAERDHAETPLTHIDLYEAYGLYEEALEAALTLAESDPDSPFLQELLDRLYAQLGYEDDSLISRDQLSVQRRQVPSEREREDDVL